MVSSDQDKQTFASNDDNSLSTMDTERRTATELENDDVKLKYPKSVFFIVVNEFCERFSFYGLRTILSVYLKLVLHYTEDMATIIYHAFIMCSYFTCIIGSIISDSWLGKFKTILYLSIIYAIGNIILSLSAASHVINVPDVAFCMLGLAIIAFGTGGIKPCVSAFGGDQFVLPQQEKHLKMFFSIFYFAINSGSLISTFLTPQLRIISCLGRDDCYTLAFGVPALLMVVAILIFFAGRPWYKVKMPEGNMVIKVSKCIGHGVAQGFKNRKQGVKHEHWLDHASDKYERKLIDEIKSMLKVLVLFLPVPVFWALFDQQGTRWTFQAMRMNGSVGTWTIQPDQMQVINPFLILFFIPLFETVIYPLLAKIGLLKRPLQRLVTGGVLAGLAFIISAIVELQIEPVAAALPLQGQSQLRIFNGISDQNFSLNSPLLNLNETNFSYQDSWTSTFVTNNILNYEVKLNDQNKRIQVENGKAFTYIINLKNGEPDLVLVSPPGGEDVSKPEKGIAKFRFIHNLEENPIINFQTTNLAENDLFTYNLDLGNGNNYTKVPVANYKITIPKTNEVLGNVDFDSGAVYFVLLIQNATKGYISKIFKFTEVTEVNENKIHMLWLIPQYVVMTAGEVMFSITGLEFSYSQAPASMKSVLAAFWQWTVAFGNVIVIIISGIKIFESQANEFFLFAGLMFADMLILILLAYRYKYVEITETEDEMELAKKNDDIMTEKGKENANFMSD